MTFEHEDAASEEKHEPERRGPGRPKGSTKLQLTDELIKQIEGLGRIQCTMREAGAVLGVNVDTFSDFLRLHEKAREAWENGKEIGKASLRRHQYKLAEQGHATMQIRLGKQWLDQTDKIDNTLSGPDGKPVIPSVNVTIGKPGP